MNGNRDIPFIFFIKFSQIFCNSNIFYVIMYFMEMLKKRKKFTRIRKLYILVLSTLLVYALANIPEIAEYAFARGITRGLSALIGQLTNPIPVSFYEWTAVLLIAGGIAFIAALVVFLCKKKFARAVTLIYRVCIAVLALVMAFGVLYAPLYNRNSVFSALGLSDDAVSEEQIYEAAEFFVEELNTTSLRLERDESGNVIMPYSFSRLATLINDEFDALDGNYFARRRVTPKRVVLSVPMSYLGITGIYFPFYAESNVNAIIPSYEYANTMAHEIAHAKGVSRENEANIVSYVICIRSEDDYMRYSGLMRAVANLLNALSYDQYTILKSRLNPEILTEYGNANAHYAKYEGFLDSISAFFNDLFLKSNGISSGTKNYGETTRGLVSLYDRLKESI